MGIFGRGNFPIKVSKKKKNAIFEKNLLLWIRKKDNKFLISSDRILAPHYIWKEKKTRADAENK